MAVSVVSPPQTVTRRGFLKAALYGAAGLALYAGEVERHWIQITERDVRLSGLPSAFDGPRVAQLSDIHMDEYTEPLFLRYAIERINQLNPDVIFLTGDFVSDGVMSPKFERGAAWQCANILTEFKCAERYAILGNHDVAVGAQHVTAALTANRIAVLNNSYLPIERSGARFWLAGLSDPLEDHPDPDQAIPASIRNIPDQPIVLLCHAPDYVDTLLTHPAGSAVSLMLSGHTHGGQVRLPFIGAMQLPVLGRKYVEGWFRLGHLQLHVNRGLGTVGVPFRFDCPPEISLITLRAA